MKIEDKKELIDIIKQIDVKKMDLDHPDEKLVKYFRFGTYNALQIVCEIIKALPEEKNEGAVS